MKNEVSRKPAPFRNGIFHPDIFFFSQREKCLKVRKHFGPLGAVDLNLGRQDVFRAQRRDMRDHLFLRCGNLLSVESDA